MKPTGQERQLFQSQSLKSNNYVLRKREKSIILLSNMEKNLNYFAYLLNVLYKKILYQRNKCRTVRLCNSMELKQFIISSSFIYQPIMIKWRDFIQLCNNLYPGKENTFQKFLKYRQMKLFCLRQKTGSYVLIFLPGYTLHSVIHFSFRCC